MVSVYKIKKKNVIFFFCLDLLFALRGLDPADGITHVYSSLFMTSDWLYIR